MTNEAHVSSAELRNAYLFAELTDEQLQHVTRDMRMLRLEKGARLFAQGEPATRFFLTRRGQVKLYRLSPDGNEKILELIQSGQSFGEALLFNDRPIGYPVHAEAVEASVVLSFDNSGFRALLRESVDTCFRLMSGMAMRLHRQINEIDRLTLHNASYRLVNYLLQQLPATTDGPPAIHLTTAKSVIASRLSIKPETFSRILARLGRKGYVEVKGNNILLRDVTALRAMVEAEDDLGL